MAFKDSIFLCGFMGTGKSTIGRRLAKRLEKPFKDLDDIIEHSEGKPIKEIFESDGETYFRKIERECLIRVSQHFKGIIALGGGALQNQQLVDHLKIHGLLVYIHTPIEVITERVMRNKRRPIVLDSQGKLKSKQTLLTELKALYSSREPLYRQAQIIIESSGYEDKDQFTEKLIDRLKRYV